LYRNLANAVSILGILPICILFTEDGYKYLIPLIVFNNIMDDLDGVLAGVLNIRSKFGANLDNLCDVVAHTVFVMMVGTHYGGFCLGFSLVAALSILLRVTVRLDPTSATGTGSPTNELMRHIFFILLLAEIFDFGPSPVLAVAFSLNAVSMLVPFALPYLLRSLAKSKLAIGAINIALVVAYLVSEATPVIAACFFLLYVFSLAVACGKRLKTTRDDAPG
jgi:phosphatidylserine synthase